MKLSEAQIRRKAIELLDGRNMTRMNLWMSSGILAGVIPADVVERVLNEEIVRRTPHVQEYWLGEPCNCRGHLN
jgi:hypothetical protein